MANALSQALPNGLFDPAGTGYDQVTADELIQLFPLTMPKPNKYMGEVIGSPDAFQAWVWHPEKNDYLMHSSSRDPRTGMLLKGLGHETAGKARAADERLGYTWEQGAGGRTYSTKTNPGMHNPHSKGY